MNENVLLSQNLKAAREKTGLTQDYVASQLHISRQAISRWETGKGLPDITTLKKLSFLYNISLDELTQNPVTSSKELPAYTSLETLALLLISVLSLHIPIIGIIIPIAILVWMKYKKKKNLIVFWIAILCIIINAYNIFVILNHYFFNFGASSVQPL